MVQELAPCKIYPKEYSYENLVSPHQAAQETDTLKLRVIIVAHSRLGTNNLNLLTAWALLEVRIPI